MVDSFKLLCELEPEERENQDTISMLESKRLFGSLTKEEQKELEKAIETQTDQERKYRETLRGEINCLL